MGNPNSSKKLKLLQAIVFALVAIILGFIIYLLFNGSIFSRNTEISESSSSDINIALESNTSESTFKTSNTTTKQTTEKSTTTSSSKTDSENNDSEEEAPAPTPTPTSAPTPAPTPAPTQPVVSPDGRSGDMLDLPFIVRGIEVVSKNHWVSDKYRPLPDSYTNNGLRDEAWTAFVQMQNAAAEEGITLVHISSYRPYELQDRLFYNYSLREGEAAANRYSARPGQSEHQTGLAIDVTAGGPLVQDFQYDPAGIWLWENAYKFGFIQRFPAGKEHITGYMFEPWHYRYIGVEHASNFGPNHSLTLEEYLGID